MGNGPPSRRRRSFDLPSAQTFRVGLISDTHGLLRREALVFLQGCHHIVHGGDIGGPDILQELSSIAPVSAVRGNNDTGAWAERLKEAEFIQVNGVCIFAIHNRTEIDIDLKRMGVRVVLSGHSHKPMIEEVDDMIFVNPGSAGPRRFKLPIALGELSITGSSVTANIVDLEAHARLDRR